jgi:hypothetical protein
MIRNNLIRSAEFFLQCTLRSSHLAQLSPAHRGPTRESSSVQTLSSCFDTKIRLPKCAGIYI